MGRLLTSLWSPQIWFQTENHSSSHKVWRVFCSAVRATTSFSSGYLPLTKGQTGGPIWRFGHSLLCYLIKSILLVFLFIGWNAHMTLPNASSSMSHLIYSLCNQHPVSCAGTKTGYAFCPSSHVLLLQVLETSQNCKERMQSHANC